jgi:hypothetical protein
MSDSRRMRGAALAVLMSAGLACASPTGGAAGPGGPIGQVSPTRIYFQAGEVDAGEPRGGLESLAGRPGRYVIQLDGPITPERRAALAGAGVRLGDYLPVNAFVARFEGADGERLAGLGFVRWHEPFRDSWKLSPEIGRRALTTNDRLFLAGLGRSVLVVDLFRDAVVRGVLDEILGLDDRADVLSIDAIGDQPVLVVSVPTDLAPRLSEIEDVQFIDEAPELTTRNESTAWIVQSNSFGFTPLWDAGLTGAGQVLGHIDDRVNINHCAFVDPEGDPPGPDHRKFVAYNASLGSQFHGTHTAGTAVGDAGVADDTRGMAYSAKIAYNTIPPYSESSLYNRLVLHESQWARVHSNSWGDDGTTSYNGLSRSIDRFVYDYEDNVVAFAVTNQSLLKNPENAKNVLAVGASRDMPQQHSHCTGGSGPTSDGRRKPEIYAPGCSSRSAYHASSCSTTSATGTSMACPAVSGIGLLVRQYYMEGFYPSGSARSADGFTPSGALVKGTLINGAVDMTGVSGYPSNREGWGRLLADVALHFGGDVRTMWVVDVRNASGLDTGETVEYPVEVLDSSESLRVTMTFTDPAGAAGTSFAPVNDLDLEVVAPDGTLYLGNHFVGGFSAPGGVKDDRNNVEQVHIDVPQTGEWTVRVYGAAVNVGAQGYALVASGVVANDSACVADFNGDGVVDTRDVLAFLDAWTAGDGSADINGDGVVDTRDVLEFLNLWNAGC